MIVSLGLDKSGIQAIDFARPERTKNPKSHWLISVCLIQHSGQLTCKGKQKSPLTHKYETRFMCSANQWVKIPLCRKALFEFFLSSFVVSARKHHTAPSLLFHHVQARIPDYADAFEGWNYVSSDFFMAYSNRSQCFLRGQIQKCFEHESVNMAKFRWWVVGQSRSFSRWSAPTNTAILGSTIKVGGSIKSCCYQVQPDSSHRLYYSEWGDRTIGRSRSLARRLDMFTRYAGTIHEAEFILIICRTIEGVSCLFLETSRLQLHKYPFRHPRESQLCLLHDITYADDARLFVSKTFRYFDAQL